MKNIQNRGFDDNNIQMKFRATVKKIKIKIRESQLGT